MSTQGWHYANFSRVQSSLFLLASQQRKHGHKTFGRSGQTKSQRSCMLCVSRLRLRRGLVLLLSLCLFYLIEDLVPVLLVGTQVFLQNS